MFKYLINGAWNFLPILIVSRNFRVQLRGVAIYFERYFDIVHKIATVVHKNMIISYSGRY